MSKQKHVEWVDRSLWDSKSSDLIVQGDHKINPLEHPIPYAVRDLRRETDRALAAQRAKEQERLAFAIPNVQNNSSLENPTHQGPYIHHHSPQRHLSPKVLTHIAQTPDTLESRQGRSGSHVLITSTGLSDLQVSRSEMPLLHHSDGLAHKEKLITSIRSVDVTKSDRIETFKPKAQSLLSTPRDTSNQSKSSSIAPNHQINGLFKAFAIVDTNLISNFINDAFTLNMTNQPSGQSQDANSILDIVNKNIYTATENKGRLLDVFTVITMIRQLHIYISKIQNLQSPGFRTVNIPFKYRMKFGGKEKYLNYLRTKAKDTRDLLVNQHSAILDVLKLRDQDIEQVPPPVLHTD